MKLNRFYNGFTLTELMIGIFFTTLAATAMVIGTNHYYKTINNIRLKQYAFEKLKGHTEFYKGLVAENEIPGRLSDCVDNPEDLCLDIKECYYKANELCYHLNEVDVGNSNARRYEIVTSIKWDNVSEVEKELNFFVVQMVF
tara:strand:- start:9 stop:434 length:426 start_codon:yes stop_codon:yes gene_type:complete